MSFWNCRNEDPFIRAVIDKYNANVVRAPRRGIDPMDILAKDHGDRVQLRGELAPYVTDSESLVLPKIKDDPVSDLSGVVASTADASLGAEITSKFIEQFVKIPVSGAELTANIWEGATGFSFQVRDVRQKYFELGELGNALRGRRVDRSQPAADIFFPPESSVDSFVSAPQPPQMYIITRTLTSPHVTIKAVGEHGLGLEAKVDAIEGLLGSANAKIGWKRESEGGVSFRGARAVTFAFAAVPFALAPDGSFQLGMEVDDISLLDGTGALETVPILIETPIFKDGDGLLDFDSEV
jgi:hypothetical protein